MPQSAESLFRGTLGPGAAAGEAEGFAATMGGFGPLTAKLQNGMTAADHFATGMSSGYRTAGRGSSLMFDSIRNFHQGGVQTFAKASVTLNSGINQMIGTFVASIGKIFFKSLDMAAQVVQGYNALIAAGFEGVQPLMRKMVELPLKAVEKMIAPIVGKDAAANMTGAIGSGLNNLITAIGTIMADRLSRSKMEYAEWAQTGGGAGQTLEQKSAGKDSIWSKYVGLMGRDKTEASYSAFMGAGGGAEKAYGKMVGYGLATGKDLGAAAEEMRQFKYFTNDATEAADKMQKTFMQIRDTAGKLGLPVSKLAAAVRESAVAARFLNADLQMVTNTMNMMIKNSTNLAKFGIASPEQMKSAVDDFSGASKKITDSLHVFYGTAGGKAGIDPMLGWAKSKFGLKEGLQFGEGGKIVMPKGAEGGGGDMMLNRMLVAQQMMADAAQGMDANQAMYVKMQVGQQLGLGDEASLALATQTGDELKKSLKDPAFASKFDDEKTILSKMLSMSAINEQLQRMMVALSIQEVALSFQAVQLAKLEFDSKFGTKEEKAAAAKEMETVKAQIKAGLDATKEGWGGVLKMITPMIPEANTRKLLTGAGKMLGVTAEQATGGWGGGLTMVGERGPEMMEVPAGSYIHPNDTLSKLASAGSGGGATNNYYINVPEATPAAIARSLAEAAKGMGEVT